jgi:hypothetical protein
VPKRLKMLESYYPGALDYSSNSLEEIWTWYLTTVFKVEKKPKKELEKEKLAIPKQYRESTDINEYRNEFFESGRDGHFYLLLRNLKKRKSRFEMDVLNETSWIHCSKSTSIDRV